MRNQSDKGILDKGTDMLYICGKNNINEELGDQR